MRWAVRSWPSKVPFFLGFWQAPTLQSNKQKSPVKCFDWKCVGALQNPYLSVKKTALLKANFGLLRDDRSSLRGLDEVRDKVRR